MADFVWDFSVNGRALESLLWVFGENGWALESLLWVFWWKWVISGESFVSILVKMGELWRVFCEYFGENGWALESLLWVFWWKWVSSGESFVSILVTMAMLQGGLTVYLDGCNPISNQCGMEHWSQYRLTSIFSSMALIASVLMLFISIKALIGMFLLNINFVEAKSSKLRI